jgi:hypothetical protein
MLKKLFIFIGIVITMTMGTLSYAVDTAVESAASCSDKPNNEFASYPVPNNCASFYKCDWGVPIFFECPTGLHFNPKGEYCDTPANAGCQQQQPTVKK